MLQRSSHSYVYCFLCVHACVGVGGAGVILRGYILVLKFKEIGKVSDSHWVHKVRVCAGFCVASLCICWSAIIHSCASALLIPHPATPNLPYSTSQPPCPRTQVFQRWVPDCRTTRGQRTMVLWSCTCGVIAGVLLVAYRRRLCIRL